MKISVIIPIGFKEIQLSYLLEQLNDLPQSSEILLITPNLDNLSHISTENSNLTIKKIISQSGRANSMNLGAKESKGEFLWFIHADSKLDKDTIKTLLVAMEKKPKNLLYFNLSFYDGPKLMKLNELGVRFRTYFLKTPFGDQGLCMRRDVFKDLGEYQAQASIGEDHLLVRQAVRKKVPLTRIKAKIYTSGRKYEKNGWLKTTLTHLYLWREQAHEDYKTHKYYENHEKYEEAKR